MKSYQAEKIKCVVSGGLREIRKYDSYLRSSDSSLVLEASNSSTLFFAAFVASECETWLTKIARNKAALS
jgi:hypothetical protein